MVIALFPGAGGENAFFNGKQLVMQIIWMPFFFSPQFSLRAKGFFIFFKKDYAERKFIRNARNHNFPSL